MAHILVIEDDPPTAREILTLLEHEGHTVACSADGAAGLARVLSGEYDAVTLDRMLPGLDGLAVIAAIREGGMEIPVLMVSALGHVDERIKGLRSGGDDYITKPFDSDELAARMEVLLRRSRPGGERPHAAAQAHAATVLRIDDVELDLIGRSARRGARAIELLPTEFRLLEFLMRNHSQLLTRRMIFEAVWGYHFDPGTNLIDVHVGRLRRKVDQAGDPARIHTVRGAGFRFASA